VGVAKITSVGLLLHHWFPNLAQWIPALGAALLLYGINMRGARSIDETGILVDHDQGGSNRCCISMRSRDPIFQDRKSWKSTGNLQSLGTWELFSDWPAWASHCTATRHLF